MYFSSAVNWEGVAYESAVLNLLCSKMLKDGYLTVMVDNWRQCYSVGLLRVEEGVSWTADTLQTHYALSCNGRSISPAQATKLIKTVSNYTLIMRYEAMFIDSMLHLVKYVIASEDVYCMR